MLWNRGEVSAEVSLAWQDLWLEPQPSAVRDLWQDAWVAATPEGFSVSVPGHDAVALRVDGVEPPLPTGRVYLSDLSWTYATNGFGPVERDQSNGEDEALDGGRLSRANLLHLFRAGEPALRTTRTRT